MSSENVLIVHYGVYGDRREAVINKYTRYGVFLFHIFIFHYQQLVINTEARINHLPNSDC